MPLDTWARDRAGVRCRPLSVLRAQRVPGSRMEIGLGLLRRSWCPSQKQESAIGTKNSGHVPDMGFESGWHMPQRVPFRASWEERNIWEVSGVWWCDTVSPTEGAPTKTDPELVHVSVYSGHPLSPHQMPLACSRSSRVVPKTEGGVRGMTGRAGFLPVLLQATSDHSDLPDIQTQRPSSVQAVHARCWGHTDVYPQYPHPHRKLFPVSLSPPSLWCLWIPGVLFSCSPLFYSHIKWLTIVFISFLSIHVSSLGAVSYKGGDSFHTSISMEKSTNEKYPEGGFAGKSKGDQELRT